MPLAVVQILSHFISNLRIIVEPKKSKKKKSVDIA